MIAVHLMPGPSGYAVLDTDAEDDTRPLDTIIQHGLTAEQALHMMNGRPLTHAGNTPIASADGVGRRKPHYVRAHNQAQSQTDWIF